MSKMAALEQDLRDMIAEVAADPDGHCWAKVLQPGATYLADPDFDGWALFTGENEQLVFCVDTTTGLCYGPVSVGIVDLVLEFLIRVQTEDGLPTR